MNNVNEFEGCVGVVEHSKNDYEFFQIESQFDWDSAETIMIGDQGNFTGRSMPEGMFKAFMDWKSNA